ncbi:CLUMA_CG013522, isoform A [Clunio marinus]|uniref:CLUMA_CG013522, isoform A n=1 Tax=Clunio marinus TaxID=568069 RepID=A0A1J1IP35_9DIPT|nr:CLUMA_CG013522, isoform A [Clunio marinus]
MSQSSSELIPDIKSIDICSETDNVSSQCSEVADEIKKLNVESKESEESSSNSSEHEKSSSSCSDPTSTTSSSSSECQPTQIKRKRKRKRPRKRKIIAAYEVPKPFTDRYKRIKISMGSSLPKIHIRFDDEGLLDKATSEFNLKPRVIHALSVNLQIHEDFNVKKTGTEIIEEKLTRKSVEKPQNYNSVIYLKPRIIKAIILG